MTTHQVQIRWWAAAADAAGTQTSTVTVPHGATLQHVLDAAQNQHPRVSAQLSVAAFLLDGHSARRTDPVPPDAVVEVLPPFAGG